MDSETTPPGETYIVSCFSCHAPFDALETSWCNCVVTKRSLVCPSCLNCFCKASASAKARFWENAPQSLWDRQMAEHRGGSEPYQNPSPGEVERPLVLVVDDEPDIQRIAIRAVGSLGYGVVFAKDGEEGLELAKLYRPDVVLTDVLMPKLDGREMCRRIKEDPATSGTKVVVMTSLYTASRYKHEALKEFHADDYLSKPLEFRDLQKVLQRLLEPSGSET